MSPFESIFEEFLITLGESLAVPFFDRPRYLISSLPLKLLLSVSLSRVRASYRERSGQGKGPPTR